MTSNLNNNRIGCDTDIYPSGVSVIFWVWRRFWCNLSFLFISFFYSALHEKGGIFGKTLRQITANFKNTQINRMYLMGGWRWSEKFQNIVLLFTSSQVTLLVPIGKLVLQSERHRHPSLTTNITFNIPNIKTYKNSRW